MKRKIIYIIFLSVIVSVTFAINWAFSEHLSLDSSKVNKINIRQHGPHKEKNLENAIIVDDRDTINTIISKMKFRNMDVIEGTSYKYDLHITIYYNNSEEIEIETSFDKLIYKNCRYQASEELYKILGDYLSKIYDMNRKKKV